MGENRSVKNSSSALHAILMEKNAAHLLPVLARLRVSKSHIHMIQSISEVQRTFPQIGESVMLAVDRELLKQLFEAAQRHTLQAAPSDQDEEFDGVMEIASEYPNIIGRSEAIRQICRQIGMVAKTESNVLIQGENGTGKEVVARTIHAHSHRRKGPLVSINCAAVPEGLLESELFGYVRGAFTGAVRDYKGRFRQADGGTIVLDEISSMPLSQQAKLLRVLQEKEVLPIGGHRAVPVDVRVIAITNTDLEEAVKKGLFREDLYFRLSVFPIFVPPLRDRKEDIPLLARHFLRKYNTVVGKAIKGFHPETMALFMSHSWPGNVRELENAVEYAVIVETEPYIRPISLPRQFNGGGHKRQGNDSLNLKRTLAMVERQVILEALAEANWVKKKAAELLGIDPRNMNYYLTKNHIDIGKEKRGKNMSSGGLESEKL